jgi:Helix-turn-helix domain
MKRARAVGVEPGYLPLKALAAYSGLCVRTLRSHLADRTRPLPHFRIGGKILVRRSDFDAWMGQFRATPSSTVGLDTFVADVVAGLR